MNRGTILRCLGLALLCLALYGNALGNGFHYDDVHSIVDNPSIRQLGNIPAFFTGISSFSAEVDKGMYRPLLLLTYSLNHALGAYDVWGYRLVNILLHALNAGLVAWLTSLLCRRRDAALIAGLLFAVHPLATEPVNYISSRSESLAAAFYLLTMALYVHARERDSNRAWYGAWVAFELGLLSKMTAVTAPMALLLYDLLSPSQRYEGARRALRLARWHAPFWVILLIHLGVVTWNTYLTRSLGQPVRDGAAQFLTQVKAAGYYLYLMLFPAHLNVEHQFSVQEHLSPTVLASLALILTGGWLVWRAHRRARFRVAALGLSWSVLLLLPVMAMPLNVLVNERRLYLPAAVLCLALGILVSRYSQRVGRAGERSVLLVVVAAVVVLSVACVQRNRVWANDFTLWTDVVRKAPMMPRGHLYLGNAHKEAALSVRDEAAKPHWLAATAAYERVIELGSDRALSLRAYGNAAGVLLTLGDLEGAEVVLRQAVAANPQYTDGLVNLGVIYLMQSRGPNYPPAAGQQRIEALRQSIDCLERAVALSPSHWQAFSNLGRAYHDRGDVSSARHAYERALLLKADDPVTLKNLALLHAQLAAAAEERGEARQHLVTARDYLHRALRTAPGQRQAREALARVQRELELLDGGP